MTTRFNYFYHSLKLENNYRGQEGKCVYYLIFKTRKWMLIQCLREDTIQVYIFHDDTSVSFDYLLISFPKILITSKEKIIYLLIWRSYRERGDSPCVRLFWMLLWEKAEWVWGQDSIWIAHMGGGYQPTCTIFHWLPT